MSSLAPHRRMPARAALALALVCALGGAAAAQAATLQPYASEAEFNASLQRWREKAQAEQKASVARSGSVLSPLAMSVAPSSMPAAPAPAAKAMAESAVAGAAASSDAAANAAGDGITNVQTAGVDEGGIVKRAGDHLVILRRGRLFTVRVGGDALAPVAMANAYAPGVDPSGAWYDEMLISGSTVVVIGYSYARGGTEIGLFELGRDGGLTYRATWHLRSGDYYSSRNFASRLIGNRLVFYAPQTLSPWRASGAEFMPGIRRWPGSGRPSDFKPILPATRIYRTDDEFDAGQALTLHTVTSCEIQGADLNCSASAVLGPTSRVFYVSAGSVYVWTASSPRRWGHGPGENHPRPASAVFRLPMDGAAPTALKTRGVPIDALSFLEDGRGFLNVLLRQEGWGEGMWGAEQGSGAAMALLRVPLSAFGDGRDSAGREHYRRLPAAPAGALNNRYIGDWLLWGGTGATNAYALSLSGDRGPVTLAAGHAIERIEALGSQAVLVGSRGTDLVFTATRLSSRDAQLAGRHVQPGAQQSESRTHGFYFRPTGENEGLLGLPIVGDGTAGRPWPDAGGSSARPAASNASVIFLRFRDNAFSALGALSATPGRPADDGCRVSCVDWYGQSRPIFIGDRVFALMGYELVEGHWTGNTPMLRIAESIFERRRIDFGPRSAQRGERHWPFE